MKLMILGAGGYGRTVEDAAAQTKAYDDICFLDDASTDAVGTCGEFHRFINQDTAFYPAFGNNALRLEWLRKLQESGCIIATIIHPTAYVSPRAKVCLGTVILPGAIVNTGTLVREGCIINCGAIVDHDCVLGEGVHVCLGAIVKAENGIPPCQKIEAGQIVGNREYPL